MKRKQNFQKVKHTPISEQESTGVFSDTHRVRTSLSLPGLSSENNLLHIFPTSLWWDGLYQSQRIGSLSVQCSAGSVLCYKHLSLVLSFEEGKKQKMDSALSSCHAFVQEENNCVSTFLQPGHATLIQQLVL